MEPDKSVASWNRHFDFGVSIVLLILAFAAVAWSDISSDQARWYWTGLAALFGVACLVMRWMHVDASTSRLRASTVAVLLWLGVIAAILVVYVFVDAGRFTNEATGLVNGLILAVGAYASGLFVQWRLAVVAAALAAGLIVVAQFEEYLLILAGLVVIAGAVMFVGARFWVRREVDADVV